MKIKEKEVVELFKYVYNEYIKKHSEKNARPQGEGYFRASSSGMCMRKNMYSFRNTKSTNPPNQDTMRVFRLGDLIHEDIQDAFESFYKENNLFLEKDYFNRKLSS